VLHVVGEAVAAFVDGYQDERRESIRREESMRREFIDDLLRGDADVAGLVERAEPFGLDLTWSHTLAGHARRPPRRPRVRRAVGEPSPTDFTGSGS
jgi:hypothetical protein